MNVKLKLQEFNYIQQMTRKSYQSQLIFADYFFFKFLLNIERDKTYLISLGKLFKVLITWYKTLCLNL